MENLKGIPERLTIAGGGLKQEALLGTLRGGYTTTLVTDEGTAAYLLECVMELTPVPKRSRRSGKHPVEEAHALTKGFTANGL